MSLKKNILANYFGQGWVALMSLAFIPFYIERLGLEAFGLVGFFALLQGIFRLIDMGMSTALNREMARYAGGATTIGVARDLVRTIEIVTYALAVLVFSTVWMFAELFGRDWFNKTDLNYSVISVAIKVMGAITALRLIEAVYTSSITGLQNQVLYNIGTASMATIRWAGCALILIVVEPTIINFFLWQLFSSALSLFLFRYKLYEIIFSLNARGNFSLKVLSSVKKFASGVFAVTVLGMVLSQSDKIYLSRSLELKEFGYYSLAVAISGGVYYLSVPIQQAYMPRLNQLYAANQHKEFINAYRTALQLIAVTIGSVSMVMSLFSKEILLIWTGNHEIATEVALLLGALCVGNLLSCLLSIPIQTNLSIGRTGRVVGIYIVSVIMYIPMIMLAGCVFGAVGVAGSWVFLNLLTFIILLPYVEQRPIFQSLKQWVSDAIKPIATALAVIYPLHEFMPRSIGELTMILYISTTLILALMSSSLASSGVRAIFLGWSGLLNKGRV